MDKSIIDFNDPIYANRSFVTKESLLEYVSEYDILKNYYPDIELGTVINSPLRKDNHPSFSLFYSEANDCILYKDQATGDIGNIFDFIQRLYNIPSYADTLEQIATDFGIDKYFIISKPKTKKLKATKAYHTSYKETYTYELKIVARDWKESDLVFWDSFGICLDTLKRFNVVPIEGYYSNNQGTSIYVNTRDLSYAFLEYKDLQLTYKIYRPFQSKERKWRTNHPYGVHQGYNQLPHIGEHLIITKSLKDVMSLYDVASIPSIAIQAETNSIKPQVMNEYISRFNNVYTLFDTDITGLESMLKYLKKYNIIGISIPIKKYPLAKDFSDLVKFYGSEKALYFLNNKLKIS
jgi:hypothetical protein